MAAKKTLVKPPFRSLSWIVRNASKFVRRDPGGRDRRKAAARALDEGGIAPTMAAVDAYLLGAKRTRDTIDRYLEPVWESLKKMVG